jgi:hypothetical protein
MRLLRVAVVLVVVLGGLTGCNSDSGDSRGWFGFRNLGKRADSSLANRVR